MFIKILLFSEVKSQCVTAKLYKDFHLQMYGIYKGGDHSNLTRLNNVTDMFVGCSNSLDDNKVQLF